MSELRIESVTKKYGLLVAVENFDLTVARGEYVFILGPNACGKSVLLRLIAGLEKPTSGSIFLNGEVTDDIPAFKRNIPMVFQKFALFPTMTARENIEYGLKIKGVPADERRQKSDQLLEMLSISAMADKKPSQLSAGQRQRVGLGRALAQDPELLLLDEPLGALDANLHLSMQFELKRLQKELGLTFIQVSHNHSDALAVADRIVLMNEGRIEQVGTPWEVFSQPRTRFAAEIFENNNVLDGVIAHRNGDSVHIETSIGLVKITSEKKYPDNHHVQLIVRRDQILIDPCDCENTFSAHLTSRTIRGSVVTYEFKIGESFLNVERHLSSGLLEPSSDQVYALGWGRFSGYLLADD